MDEDLRWFYHGHILISPLFNYLTLKYFPCKHQQRHPGIDSIPPHLQLTAFHSVRWTVFKHRLFFSTIGVWSIFPPWFRSKCPQGSQELIPDLPTHTNIQEISNRWTKLNTTKGSFQLLGSEIFSGGLKKSFSQWKKAFQGWKKAFPNIFPPWFRSKYPQRLPRIDSRPPHPH